MNTRLGCFEIPSFSITLHMWKQAQRKKTSDKKNEDVPPINTEPGEYYERGRPHLRNSSHSS